MQYVATEVFTHLTQCSASDWTEIFLITQNQYNSHSLPRDSCVLGVYAFNKQPGSLQLCLSTHFLLMQSLKSARGENIGASQLFSEHFYSHGNVHNPVYRVFPKIHRSFQSFCEHLIPQIFFLSSWLVHCLLQLLFTFSDSHEVQQLIIIILTKVLREKSVCTGRIQSQSQVKYRQQRRSDIDSKDRNYQPDEIMIILWE